MRRRRRAGGRAHSCLTFALDLTLSPVLGEWASCEAELVFAPRGGRVSRPHVAKRVSSARLAAGPQLVGLVTSVGWRKESGVAAAADCAAMLATDLRGALGDRLVVGVRAVATAQARLTVLGPTRRASRASAAGDTALPAST